MRTLFKKTNKNQPVLDWIYETTDVNKQNKNSFTYKLHIIIFLNKRTL